MAARAELLRRHCGARDGGPTFSINGSGVDRLTQMETVLGAQMETMLGNEHGEDSDTTDSDD